MVDPKKVEWIFGEVFDAPQEERSALLDKLCGDDTSLRAEVESLLQAGQLDSVELVEGFRDILVTEFPEESLEGQTIGGFHIIRQIGKGGMGTIYLAEDPNLSREVAIKFLSKSLTGRPEQVELFFKEARIASKLNDPGIVTIHRVENQKDRLFIVMELVRGDNLRHHLREGPIEVKDAVSIALRVAEGLKTAHEAGIVHCDIKPENVMIGERSEVKILDFGLARFGMALSQQQDRVIRGTPGYMSPEQACGGGVDGRSDIYSLGIMLHEMVCGLRPHSPEEPEVELPSWLRPVIARSIAQSPESRYQSVTEMIADLRREPRSGFFKFAVPVIAALVILSVVGAVLYFQQIATRGTGKTSALKVSGLAPFQWGSITPDGQQVLFNVIEKNNLKSVWIRDLKTNLSRQIISNLSGAYRWPTISPDGKYAYLVRMKDSDYKTSLLIRVPLAGGKYEKVADNVDSPIAFSPDGESYAYITKDRENDVSVSRLMIVGSDGIHRNLHTRRGPGDYPLDGPAWSPDGKTIATPAISTAECVYYNVVGVDVKTGVERPLTKLRWGHIMGIDWLRDNSGIVISAKKNGAELVNQLYLLLPDSGEEHQITDDYGSYIGRPSSSQDSQTIFAINTRKQTSLWFNLPKESGTFQNYTPGDTLDGDDGITWSRNGHLAFTSRRSGHENVWTSDLSGSDWQLTRNKLSNRYPAASPDGRYIIFSSSQSGHTHLTRIDSDGKNQIELTDGLIDQDPDVSPDSQWIIYSSINSGKRTIWRVPINGGNPEQITKKVSESPVISPDGRWIAALFQEGDRSDWYVGIIPFEGTEPIAILRIKRPLYPGYRYFRWSPDGRAIDYIDLDGNTGNIWRMKLDGSAPFKLTDFSRDLIFGFRWSPDGTRLAAVRGSIRNEAMLIARR
jgi:serine/threonine protein kinase